MRNPKQVRKMWDKLLGPRMSPYKHMDSDVDTVQPPNEKISEKPQFPNAQNNLKSHSDAENKKAKKEKKKRKGWKRIRHAALMTCRYIGMGVSHMSPVSTYPVPDYNVDPVWWCNSVQGKTSPAPHWSTGFILNGW